MFEGLLITDSGLELSLWWMHATSDGIRDEKINK
jgi:hypothetical protein